LFLPIKNPGEITVDYEVTVLQNIEGRLPVTVDIIRTVAGLSLPVRCTNFQGIYFGSCTQYDFCLNIFQNI
jgi:hypothetical protein